MSRGRATGSTASVINEGSEGKGSSERLFGKWQTKNESGKQQGGKVEEKRRRKRIDGK
jgi:hypothetical protein